MAVYYQTFMFNMDVAIRRHTLLDFQDNVLYLNVVLESTMANQF